MFHVLLHEPEIPPNTGNLVRLCANTGCTLHLIEPLGFELSARAVRRAGLDYHALAGVRTHPTLREALDAVAGGRLFVVETGGGRCYADARFAAGDALLFGSETRGLSPAALAQARAAGAEHLAIPMHAGNRSLNLANAVTLVVYEAWRQHGFAGAAPLSRTPAAPDAP
jgi:tRNA (cytidine/uridine-2'-O-)-methyltransferase